MDSKCVYSHGVFNLVTVIAICAVAPLFLFTTSIWGSMFFSSYSTL